jgi:hypothetical protein
MHVVVLGDVGYGGGVLQDGKQKMYARLKSERRGLLVFFRLQLGLFPAQGRPVRW